MIPNLDRLQDKLGYRFKDNRLLSLALSHSSVPGEDNERLEFLGDRVLNLVIAAALFKRFPAEQEGSLAKRHAALVQGQMCATMAGVLDLGDFILMSEAERQSGGAENENILSDGIEAILGAIYLDGGLDQAQSVVLRLWGQSLETVTEPNQDPKTELQEWLQARGIPLPDYDIADKSGPDHAPVFVIEVKVQGKPPIRAEGPSRRQAEKTAARIMLRALKGEAE
jgi:ribonuclease III